MRNVFFVSKACLNFFNKPCRNQSFDQTFSKVCAVKGRALGARRRARNSLMALLFLVLFLLRLLDQEKKNKRTETVGFTGNEKPPSPSLPDGKRHLSRGERLDSAQRFLGLVHKRNAIYVDMFALQTCFCYAYGVKRKRSTKI